MKQNHFYIGCGVVFVASLLLIVILRYSIVSEVILSLAGIPAVLALFGALFQLARDRIEFDRSVLMEQSKNAFTVGATSHMAIVAFDKHVLFCEEYITEVRAALDTLTRRGPHADLLVHSSKLYAIREKWALWITPEIGENVGGFENALRRIGSDAWLADQHLDMEDRPALVKKMFSEFKTVMGIDIPEEEQLSEEVRVLKVFEALRKALGIEQLTSLRSELIQRAVTNLHGVG